MQCYEIKHTYYTYYMYYMYIHEASGSRDTLRWWK